VVVVKIKIGEGGQVINNTLGYVTFVEELQDRPAQAEVGQVDLVGTKGGRK
jgi:hypothetical protein